jgi:hypothetical protein
LELILGYGIIDIQGEEIHVLATGGRTHPLPSLKLRQTKPAPLPAFGDGAQTKPVFFPKEGSRIVHKQTKIALFMKDRG